MSLGTRFGTAADDYERGRPTYPHDAVAWMLRDVTGPVADVGAGTGKLASVIAGQGFDVTAVDPDAGMLAALSAVLPQVPTAVGTAESLPLADGSVGAITFGQAWHWVDVPAASAEVARVLRPGGVLGLIWNIRDESVDWVRALGEAMGASRAESMISADEVVVGEPFGAVEERIFRWENSLTHEQVRSMVRSRSYYIAGDPGSRSRIDAGVDEVLAALGTDAVAMAYVTHAFRTTRP